MRYADYIPNYLKDYGDDPLRNFMGGIHIIPHSFGHQHGSPFNITLNDRVTGDFEIIYIIGGYSIITISNTRYDCYKGDLVLIPPFTKHSILTTEDNPHDNYWLHFDIKPVSMYHGFIKTLMSGNSHLSHLGLLPSVISLYARLEEENYKKLPGYYSYFSTLTTQIVTEILRNKINSQSLPYTHRKNAMECDTVERAIGYIHNNISSGIVLSDITNKLHISKSYLFKCFSNVLGMSPSRFIQTTKIKQAERLLITTDMTVSEIADKTGYSSSYYMSKVFKDFYDTSPTGYRKSFIKY